MAIACEAIRGPWSQETVESAIRVDKTPKRCFLLEPWVSFSHFIVILPRKQERQNNCLFFSLKYFFKIMKEVFPLREAFLIKRLPWNPGLVLSRDAAAPGGCGAHPGPSQVASDRDCTLID